MQQSFYSIYNISESVFGAYRHFGKKGALTALRTGLNMVVQRHERQSNTLNHSLSLIISAVLGQFLGEQTKEHIKYQSIIVQKMRSEPKATGKIQIILVEFSFFIDHFEGVDHRISDQILIMLDSIPLKELSALTVGSIAEQFNLSLSHLSKKFKSEYGQNLKDVITSSKLDRAYQLLSKTGLQLTIDELSQSLGFRSTNHFRKLFKQKYGVPPSKVRRST